MTKYPKDQFFRSSTNRSGAFPADAKAQYTERAPDSSYPTDHTLPTRAVMKVEQTAVGKALAIPEIVDYILSFACIPEYKGLEDFSDQWYYDEAFRFTSYLPVNKLWSSLAAKYVWRQCGYRPGPLRYDLAKLATSPDRLQWFASFVEELYVNYETSRSDSKQLIQTPMISEKSDSLALGVAFPRLTKIRIAGQPPPEEGKLHLFQLTLSYLRPSLIYLESQSISHSAEVWILMKVRNGASGG